MEILPQDTSFQAVLTQYDAVFHKRYAKMIGELHARTTPIPYTKITSIHYQTLSKKVTTWKADANNLSVCLLKGLLSPNFDEHDNFTNKHKKSLRPYHQKRFSKNQWDVSYTFYSRHASQKQLRWAK